MSHSQTTTHQVSSIEKEHPSICFVGLNNLPVLSREFSRFDMGGESVQHTLLARALHRRGHRTSMVVADLGQPDGATWDGITTYKAYARSAGIPILRFVHPRWTGLASALRRANADIYYISCGGAAVGQVVMFALHAGRRVVFRVAHDGDCLRDDKERIPFWRDRRLYEHGLRRASAILAQTEIQRECMLQNFGLPSTVAGMLVDPPSRTVPLEDRDITVLWVNNMRPFKRPDLAIQLAVGLSPTIMHMVGGRAGRFDGFYEEVASAANAIPNLRFHGQIPYQDVNDFYERARVFVNTSDSEGFPNSYLQAWVRGTPVVAFFDPDGIIAREGLGYVAGDLDSMQSAVKKLATDGDAWLACSTRCRAYMARRYDPAMILAPYLSTFDQLAHSR